MASPSAYYRETLENFEERTGHSIHQQKNHPLIKSLPVGQISNKIHFNFLKNAKHKE
tara:strand:+ start:485 stop:655 length:171 start_codon:yes stop_codon:yes gene_type:complete